MPPARGPSLQASWSLSSAAARAAERRPSMVPAALLRNLPLGSGRPLPELLRRHMESYFGADFSAVRVHVGNEPKLIGARAFTMGSNIFIEPASYNPSTAAGRELLGHELAHVLQQRSGRLARAQAGAGSRGPGIVEDSVLEAEAAFMGALAAAPQPAPPALQSPRGARTRAATEGTGIPVGVIQMARFTSDGSPLRTVGAQVYRYYDTENVQTFGRWIDYLHANDAQNTLRRLLQNLAGRIPGTRGERIAASRARRALNVLEWAPPAGGYSALAQLPRRSWWKLFIEGRHHGQANGALYFDLDQSPGFYDTMMRAFEQELLPVQQADARLDFDGFDTLHRLVTNGVLRDTRGPDFEPVPHQTSSRFTQFPMTMPPQIPNVLGLAEMQFDHELRAHDAVVFPDDYNAVYQRNNTPGGAQWVIRTNYNAGEVRGKVNALFTRYYSDLQAARVARDFAEVADSMRQRAPQRGLSNLFGLLSRDDDDEDGRRQREEARRGTYQDAVLEAIVRLVRALHVGHFYTDANGRLNTVLLLNKLLLQNGFTPAIIQDNAIFGGRMNKGQLVAEVRTGLRAFAQEVLDAALEVRPVIVQGEVETTASYLRQGGELGLGLARDYGVYALGAVVAYYYWG